MQVSCYAILLLLPSGLLAPKQLTHIRSPVWEYWTLSSLPQNCINEAAHLLAAGLINTVTDFTVVILPIKTVARLKLPRRQYIILIGLFGAGFCACIAGCVRTYYTWIYTVDYDTTVSLIPWHMARHPFSL
jgi:hypothetical protein